MLTRDLQEMKSSCNSYYSNVINLLPALIFQDNSLTASGTKLSRLDVQTNTGQFKTLSCCEGTRSLAQVETCTISDRVPFKLAPVEAVIHFDMICSIDNPTMGTIIASILFPKLHTVIKNASFLKNSIFQFMTLEMTSLTSTMQITMKLSRCNHNAILSRINNLSGYNIFWAGGPCPQVTNS
jgi:hypothetical protein